MSDFSWYGLPLYEEVDGGGDSIIILSTEKFLGSEIEGGWGSFTVAEVPTSSAERFVYDAAISSEIDLVLSLTSLQFEPEIRLGHILGAEFEIDLTLNLPQFVENIEISSGSFPDGFFLHYPLNTVWENRSPNYNPLSPVNQAKIVSDVGVFGDGSAYFDGSADRYWTDTGLSFGNADFTIDFWIYLRNGGSTVGRIVMFGPEATNGTLLIYRGGSDNIYLATYSGSWVYPMTAQQIGYDTWTHIRLCRKEGTWRFFTNGTKRAEFSNPAGSDITQSILSIGSNTSNGHSLFGNIADLRITYGKALSIENFTPPASRYPVIQSNTSLIRDVLNYGCNHDSTLAIPQDTNVNEVLVQTNDTRARFTDTLLRGDKTSTHRFSGSGTITGTLFRIGSPLPNAEVSLYERRTMMLVETAVTGENGSFVFQNIDPEADLYLIASDPEGELLPASDIAGNDLYLYQSKIKNTVDGRLVTGGAGSPGVDVSLYDWDTRMLIARAVTDSGGFWSATLPEGQFMATYTRGTCKPTSHGPYE